MLRMQIESGRDWRSVDRWKLDLLTMLNAMRGPGRGVEIGKSMRFFLRKGYTREQAKKELATNLPMLAAAQELRRARRDLVLVRYRDSEVLAFRVDLEMNVSNIAIAEMERTGQLRPETAIIVPGERGSENMHPSEDK